MRLSGRNEFCISCVVARLKEFQQPRTAIRNQLLKPLHKIEEDRHFGGELDAREIVAREARRSRVFQRGNIGAAFGHARVRA